MKKLISAFLIGVFLSGTVYSVVDSKLSSVANSYVGNIMDLYKGAPSRINIDEILSEDFYPLRRTFIDEFKYSQKQNKSCQIEYHINKIDDQYLEFHIDINWQKKVRKFKSSVVETRNGRSILIFDKTGKLLKLKGDNPFR